MRLRLVHTLSLLLLSAVLLAVLAMGAVTAWNLKSGFADYLEARDVERLEREVALQATVAVAPDAILFEHFLLVLYVQRRGMDRERLRRRRVFGGRGRANGVRVPPSNTLYLPPR